MGGFFAEGTLKKVELNGQNAVTLCRAANPYGAVWHPDGTIYFASSFGRSIMRVSDNGGAPESIVESPLQGYVWPELLPDGASLLATRMDEAVVSLSIKSREEKVLRDFPDAVNRIQVSTEGGEEPVWSPKGDELFYRNGQEWMTVAVDVAAPVPVAGRPGMLFRGDYLNVPGRSYDVMPDGQSFVLIRRTADDTTTTQLNVVLNWFEELRRDLARR